MTNTRSKQTQLVHYERCCQSGELALESQDLFLSADELLSEKPQ